MQLKLGRNVGKRELRTSKLNLIGLVRMIFEMEHIADPSFSLNRKCNRSRSLQPTKDLATAIFNAGGLLWFRPGAQMLQNWMWYHFQIVLFIERQHSWQRHHPRPPCCLVLVLRPCLRNP